jgi:hypothetical protein
MDSVMKQSFTQKLFFDKYDHKVVLNVSPAKRRDTQSNYPHREVVEESINKLEPKDGMRTRHSESYSRKYPAQHTIYFADKRILELLEKKYSAYLVEVMKPLNDHHTQALTVEKVLVRKKLFHGKYRFCVRTSRKHIPNTYKTTSEHMERMVKWCKSTYTTLEERKDFYIYDGWTKSFFFAHASDVLMMKLTWAEDIDRIERIMLIDELPEGAENQE